LVGGCGQSRILRFLAPLVFLHFILKTAKKRREFLEKSGTLGKFLRDYLEILREFCPKLTE
ncbi:MAG: hypothetical protein J1E77_04680, partial [Prevotella sp.]|nr:hypothetical protein [Prevotella sp.]